MSRRRSREQAFIFLFESTFALQSPDEIIKYAQSIREEKISDFAKVIFEGVLNNLDNIDSNIEENLSGWEKERLSKTVISILRIAVFEMFYCPETPISVAINEAVELSKKYTTEKETVYINGVLGAVSKKLERKVHSLG